MAEPLTPVRLTSTGHGRCGLLAWLGLVVLGVTLVWLLGLIRFAWSIPDSIADSQTPTDAIVILTGGSERIETGLALLIENKAHKAFVSGVAPSVTIEKILALSGNSSKNIRSRIESGYSALDTAGNASETAHWIKQHGYRSLRLVTSSYHMPRSLLEFKRALPDVRIIPHPVFSDRVRPKRWWDSPGTVILIMGEYNKYLLSSIRAFVSAGFAPIDSDQ